MKELMEITVVVHDDKLKDMLARLEAEKKKGNHSVMIEHGAVTFHVCSALESDE